MMTWDARYAQGEVTMNKGQYHHVMNKIRRGMAVVCLRCGQTTYAIPAAYRNGKARCLACGGSVRRKNKTYEPPVRPK